MLTCGGLTSMARFYAGPNFGTTTGAMKLNLKKRKTKRPAQNRPELGLRSVQCGDARPLGSTRTSRTEISHIGS